MVARAGLVGAASALLTAVAELVANPWFGIDPDDTSLEGLAAYYGLVFSVTGVAAFLEIMFLYWDALRSVHMLARGAGLSVFESHRGSLSPVASALARAALELPNPPGALASVDPFKEVARWEAANRRRLL